MDRSLRNSLTSSVGTSVEIEKSLSEIARAVLVDAPGDDPTDLREKAGLLALLNLLGIVEAFYCAGTPAAQRTTATAPPTPSDSPFSLVSSLARLIPGAAAAESQESGHRRGPPRGRLLPGFCRDRPPASTLRSSRA